MWTWVSDTTFQALEGKDVKDLLLNVGSGGGAAPAAGGAAAAGGDAAGDAAPAEEEKAEGTILRQFDIRRTCTNKSLQRRRSPTTTWASVSSTKRLLSSFLSPFAFLGVAQHGSTVHIPIGVEIVTTFQ